VTAWLASGSGWEGIFQVFRFLAGLVVWTVEFGPLGLLLFVGICAAVIGIGWAWNRWS
jgi:hypothetical protein